MLRIVRQVLLDLSAIIAIQLTINVRRQSRLDLFLVRCHFFFFQAEDGIRDVAVTGVQTCALPIYAAAEEPAAVIVYVESEVDARPKCVRPVNPRDVVHELWRGDRTLCVWRQAVRPVDVQRRSQHTVVSPDGNLLWIRKVGIGLSEGELKREAVETGREFVHQRRRKIMSVADFQILPKPVHFTQWWKSGVHLGPCVEEVTLLCIESILQPPDKDR